MTKADITISVDDLSGDDTAALVTAHKAEMLTVSPWDSSHALLLDGLRDPSITLWRAEVGGTLAALGGLRRHDAGLGEIKSMHTAKPYRGKGLRLGAQLLDRILATARDEGLRRVSLETGTQSLFEPAWALYAKYGFTPCGPFAHYVEDPNSRFFTLAL